MYPESENQIYDYVKEFEKIIKNNNYKSKNIFLYELSLFFLNIVGKIKKIIKKTSIKGADFFMDGYTKKFINDLVDKK